MGKLIKNTSYYTIGNVLPQLFGFILLPLYSRYLTSSEYGVITSMQVLTSVITIFFTLSMDSSIYRLYYDYSDDKSKRDYLGTITLSMIMVASIMLILLFLFRNMVSHIYRSISFFPFYVIAIFTAYLNIFFSIPKIYFQVKEKAAKFVTLSILQFLSTTSLIIWFVVFKREGAVGMLKGVLFGNIILLPIFLYLSFSIINIKFSWKILKPTLSYSLPVIPYVLSGWIITMSNRIFIDQYFTTGANGIFSMAYKIASISLVITTAIALAYNPVFFRLANSLDQARAKKELYRYNTVIMVIYFTIAFLVVVFGKDLIFLFLHPKFREAYKIIPLIAFGNLFTQIISLQNLSFSQEKKTKQLMFIVIASAIINVIFNFILIPPYGIIGAACAFIISQASYFIIGHFFSRKYYYIPYNLYIIIPTIIVFLGFATLNFFIIKVTWLSFILKAVLFIVITIILYFLFYRRVKEIITS